ncbi:MAG TPA: NUDIX hydrolase [Longimicrobiales bacterium]|nr:NUDIX hydrolase [Longimicrobiales bacterium]
MSRQEPGSNHEHPLVDAQHAARTGPDKPGQLHSRPVHHGRVVDLAVDTVLFPDGSRGELELVRHSGAAAVLPVLDHDDDPRILLIRQFRYAAAGDILEVPAGRPEPGEDWDTCARRELEEEVGLKPGTLLPLTTIFTTPGFTDERIHLFLAFDNQPGTVHRDADEFLQLQPMHLSHAIRLVHDGTIVDAKSIITILLAADWLAAHGNAPD